jgi:outer membrane protein
MKKILTTVALLALPLLMEAQAKFGYVSYEALYKSMPEYQEAQTTLENLRKKYDSEAERSEADFNKKFAEFLQGQKEFPEIILQKRQKELVELMERGIQFRDDMKELLKNAESGLMEGVTQKLNSAIQKVGIEKGYSYIINIDHNACPFIHPELGEDATEAVKAELNQLAQ